MKRSVNLLLTLSVAAFVSATDANAQKIAIGDRAPEISVNEWLTPKPPDDKARLIDFFHSTSKQAWSLLSVMNDYAKKYADRMAVIVIVREPKEKVEKELINNSPAYHVAIDEGGKTFAAFGVNVVPFGVLVDAKGKIVWFGNPAQLDSAKLDKLLK